MKIQLITHGDALRHTAKRVVVAVSLTVALTLAMTLMRFGTDPDASVRAGFVTVSVIGIGIIVSALLTAGLSYRSALVMQELTLTRAELLRISRTDQLTGLLNRRGFDEAAISALAKTHEENLSAVALMCILSCASRSCAEPRTESFDGANRSCRAAGVFEILRRNNSRQMSTVSLVSSRFFKCIRIVSGAIGDRTRRSNKKIERGGFSSEAAASHVRSRTPLAGRASGSLRTVAAGQRCRSCPACATTPAGTNGKRESADVGSRGRRPTAPRRLRGLPGLGGEERPNARRFDPSRHRRHS
jgi:hypothetical protein